eukprot:7136503-Pyramimonas_sp.AAC.1
MAPQILTASALLQNWLSREDANPKMQAKAGRRASGRTTGGLNGTPLIPLARLLRPPLVAPPRAHPTR